MKRPKPVLCWIEDELKNGNSYTTWREIKSMVKIEGKKKRGV